MKKLMTTIFALSTLAAPAMASGDIQLGEPGYGGTGCPAGTASTVLSPDNKSLSIIFDEFLVEAGGETGKRLDRKSCNIAIPVHVPQGLSVSVIDVDYRGYMMLPRGANARFSAEYFFAGARGPRYNKTFRGEMDDDYMISNTLAVVGQVWSPCGKDVNLRVNSSMTVRTNSRKHEALSTVDSADFNAGIVYKLQWKKCRGEEPQDDFWF
ncbi:DUF4360 domain-containing protein [Halobacteriovorax sp. HLS]|uniref:DUF4360 domain-containing protein n=1 Tax=Halobacteriovorax sp. HLS TaxID=2234000 RepID=UPI000FD89343|nr:DUF4360 domain-containing protein [Halobacteriovorax sp. HLS]